MKWGLISVNMMFVCFVFLNSSSSREKLLPCLDKCNIEKTRIASALVIIAEDMEFYEKLPKLAPNKNVRSYFIKKKALIKNTTFHNSNLQKTYFIITTHTLKLNYKPIS